MEINKLKIMMIPSHLSSGGMPQYLLRRVEALLTYTNFEIFVVEFNCVSLDFIIQRNKIKNIVQHFYTLGEDKNELMNLIRENSIDVLQFDDPIEFIPNLSFDLACQIYSNDRTWRICETIHTVNFNKDQKIFFADAYPLVSPFHLDILKSLPGIKGVILYPVNNKKSSYIEQLLAKQSLGFPMDKPLFINIGLWNKNKNQGEFIDIAKKYPDMEFAAIGNLAGNFKNYWETLINNVPSNFHIMEERDDVSTFLCAADGMIFTSIYECMPICLFEAIEVQIPILAYNLKEYMGVFNKYIQPIDSNLNNLECNYTIPTDNVFEDFGKNYKSLYEYLVTTSIVLNTPKRKVTIISHFVDNPYIEIHGDFTAMYNVKFFDGEILVYENTVSGKDNPYIKLNRQWFTPWRIEVRENDRLIYNESISFKNKRVMISFESKALGDTLAWLPYMEKFMEKHQCQLIVSTFWNKLFKPAYPEIEFVEPGSTVQNLHGLYRLGYFYDINKNPQKVPSSVPLQQTACDILGLQYEELLPRQFYVPKKRMYDFKYITIATNSTSGCKFWQKEDWQKVIDFLISQGYKVINVSKEKNPFKGADQIVDTSIENTMYVIWHSEFMIGLSSGLSWLNWAMGKKTVLIANFTNKDYEFKTNCIRITNTNVCHDCWSKEKFDAGNYHWCPYHEKTPRALECHTSISGEMVIERIKKELL